MPKIIAFLILLSVPFYPTSFMISKNPQLSTFYTDSNYTGRIPQRLDTDVHNAVTAKTSTASFQFQFQRPSFQFQFKTKPVITFSLTVLGKFSFAEWSSRI